MSNSPAIARVHAPRLVKPSLLWEWFSLAACALMIVIGSRLQSGVHLNHDVAWILHGARWMLDGGRFGQDIIDVNPPLIWFVSLPAAWLVNLGLGTEPAAMRLYVWTLCAVSLLMCHRLLRPMREQGAAAESAALLAGAAYAMTILPAAAFAQREHLAFVLGMPYCLLLAARLRGDPVPRALGIACGAFAGIAFGFKPWFLAVPLLLELVHLARFRALRATWRAETVALAATLLVYLSAVLVFAREYLTAVVPMAVATYWAYDDGLPFWAHMRVPALAALLALGFLAIARRVPAHAVALVAAFAGFSFSHWSQHKGFAYHAYPAMACAITLLAYATVLAARSLSSVRLPVGGWLKIAMASCLVIVSLNCVRLWYRPVAAWAAIYDVDQGFVGRYRSLLIERINATVARGGYVYAFSTHPFPAFPTMSYTAAEWGSPMVGQFTIPALMLRDQVSDPRRRAALDRAVQAQRQQVMRDFERHSPAMVLVDAGDSRLGMHGRVFDDIAYYSTDPRFAAIWSQYTETESIGSLRVFLRRKPSDPTTAAWNH